jgi:hypothetical protein
MVPAYSVKPAFEVLYFEPRDVPDQYFKNLHHCILAVLPVFEIFHANPVNKVHISFVQDTQYFQVRLFPEQPDQFFIGMIFRYI